MAAPVVLAIVGATAVGAPVAGVAGLLAAPVIVAGLAGGLAVGGEALLVIGLPVVGGLALAVLGGLGLLAGDRPAGARRRWRPHRHHQCRRRTQTYLVHTVTTGISKTDPPPWPIGRRSARWLNTP
ncbi:hypothetical protein [Nocardia sp. NPDC004604]|uniref:hypothetical protein n=1 Tax=Nocardia sp. NPDC004604 TaxID=3157013 RepID=UPI0033A74FB9